jgi:hypothetical protein
MIESIFFASLAKHNDCSRIINLESLSLATDHSIIDKVLGNKSVQDNRCTHLILNIINRHSTISILIVKVIGVCFDARETSANTHLDNAMCILVALDTDVVFDQSM